MPVCTHPLNEEGNLKYPGCVWKRASEIKEGNLIMYDSEKDIWGAVIALGARDGKIVITARISDSDIRTHIDNPDRKIYTIK